MQSKYVFQCTVKNARDELVELLDSGNNNTFQAKGRNLMKFVEDTYRTNPDWLEGLQPQQFVQKLVNGNI